MGLALETGKVVAAFVLGLLLGVGGWGQLVSGLLDPALYVMLFAVGVLVGLERDPWRLLARRGIGGVALGLGVLASGALAGYLLGLARGLDPYLSAAAAAGSGWYSFTGPLLAEYDAYLGLVAFVSNMGRELATIMLYPHLARCCPLQGVAMGGATTMDSTLPVVARYGGPEAALLGLVQGLVVTLLVPIVVPVLASAGPGVYAG